MLKDYLLERNTSVYRLAKSIGEPYSTLNDLSNGKVDIDECRVKLLRKIAEYFDVSLEEMYKECQHSYHFFSEKYETEYLVDVKKKEYVLSFDYNDVHREIELGKVTEESTMHIEEIALAEMEKVISQIRNASSTKSSGREVT